MHQQNSDLEVGIKHSHGGFVVAWTVLVLLSVLYWHFFGVLSAFGEHWPLMAIMILLGLTIAGRLGTGLGVPLLFRNAPDKSRQFGPSFWSGFGVTLLCTLILIVIFICTWLDLIQKEVEFKRLRRDMNNVNPPVLAQFNGPPPATDRAETDGSKSRSRLPWDRYFNKEIRDWRPHSMIDQMFRTRVDDKTGQKVQPHSTAVPAFLFIFVAGVPFWLLLAACVLGADPPSAGLSKPRPWSMRVMELSGYFLGWIVMMLITSAFAYAHAILQPYDLFTQAGGTSGWWLLDRLIAFTRFQSWSHFSSFVFFIGFVILLPTLVIWFYRGISPGLGICLLLCMASLMYLCLNVIVPGVRLVVASLLVAGLVLQNRRSDRYRFPGMSRYYQAPIDLEANDKEVEQGEIPPGPCDDGLTPLLLNDRQVLERWARHAQSLYPDRRPKLILLAVTGAAYRASFWTTLVLERLEEEIPGFLDHVRLVTGASGGMVGAAYAVALKRKNSANITATDQLINDSGLDSLTPVVQQLIRRDIPLAVHWLPQKYDRGRALEDQWKALDISFEDLRAGEAEGWRPSLIISPMVVETGRRLLFSNLDLYGLTDLQARKRIGVSCEPQDRGPLPPLGGHRRFSRSAVEFFRAFPDSYRGKSGDAFKVKTAVRMNATFPFISPAVNLPVVPPRRVVDAGYYDNYGINLAASWAYQNRDWIRANTSGLAIVQIRAYESEDVRKRLWVSPRDRPLAHAAGPLSNIGIGVQALTTPFHGVMGAMKWSMSYRNDEQIQLLDDTFNCRYIVEDGDYRVEVNHTREKGEPGWFESFVFENSVPFGMNWFVSAAEIDRMKTSLHQPLRNNGQANPRPKVSRSHARQQTLEREARDQNMANLDHFKKWWIQSPESDPERSSVALRPFKFVEEISG